MSTCLGSIVSKALTGDDETTFERNTKYGVQETVEDITKAAVEKATGDANAKIDALTAQMEALFKLVAAQQSGTVPAESVEVKEKTPAEKAAETRAANKAKAEGVE